MGVDREHLVGRRDRPDRRLVRWRSRTPGTLTAGARTLGSEVWPCSCARPSEIGRTRRSRSADVQPHSAGDEFIDDVAGVGHGADESVKLGDDQGVAVAAGREGVGFLAWWLIGRIV